MNEIRIIVDWIFLTYGSLLFTCYFLLILFALLSIKNNKKRSKFLSISNIKRADDLPTVTLVAPAYNEAKTIVTNIYSLLSIQYPYLDVIVVNDGSKDNCLDEMVKAFKMKSISFPTQRGSNISHQPTRAVYKSELPEYGNLTVIDKLNGGRSDALNCGIAAAESDLILCTDADCIIDQDALLKMVRPYLEELDREVIASGGGIGIVNDSVIKNGTLKELKVPKSLLARIQIVEYIRAFLLGRMGWSYLDGLMLVSGAFGLYPRKRVEEVGGFDHKTVGEDLELCMRLRVHMEKQKLPYDVVYIPETLCWTEAPATPKIYHVQRDRWARGLWETMRKHKNLFYNPRFGSMGLVFYPYWIYFELWAPIMEFLGIAVIVTYVILGILNWKITLLLFLAVYLLGCVFSSLAILIYVINFRQYAKFNMVNKLLLAAFLEPFTSHPVMLFAAIKGYFKKIFGIKSGWGNMSRQGFEVTAK